jgi:hypothetical protein
MALRFFDNESDSLSKVSSDAYDENFDFANKFKSNLPINKKKKPKRNRSAFIIFSSEMRAKIRSEQKDKLNSNEMMVKLATMWKELPEDEKKVYFDQAEKEKVRYLLELNDFYQTFPFEVIQNKTKKNHVKKPCSAYALYLKEQKKVIKTHNPNLKMADILKVVGEKWKSLSEEERSVYQEKALAEKEMCKAKINEHMIKEIEDNRKAPIPQKRVQNQKRIQKALLKEHVKIETLIPDFPKIELDAPKLEEPALIKHQVTSFNNNNKQINLLDTNNDFSFDFNQFFGSNFPKLGLPEPSTFTRIESNDPALNKDASFLVSLCETTNRVAKRSSDLILDLLNFHSRNETVNSSAIENVNSCMAANEPKTNTTISNRAQMMNDTLVNCLNFEPDFNFDSFNVKLQLLLSLSSIDNRG